MEFQTNNSRSKIKNFESQLTSSLTLSVRELIHLSFSNGNRWKICLWEERPNRPWSIRHCFQRKSSWGNNKTILIWHLRRALRNPNLMLILCIKVLNVIISLIVKMAIKNKVEWWQMSKFLFFDHLCNSPVPLDLVGLVWPFDPLNYYFCISQGVSGLEVIFLPSNVPLWLTFILWAWNFKFFLPL